VIHCDTWVILSTVVTGHEHITSDVFCFDGSRKEVRFCVIVCVAVKIAVCWM